MYKFAEKKLMEEVEKLENEFKPKNEELKDITERLNNIDKYDNLKFSNSQWIAIGLLSIIVGGTLGGFEILAIIKCILRSTLLFGPGLLIGLGGASVFFLALIGIEIKFIKEHNNKIKDLKQKGVKKDIKEQSVLLEKKEELEKEKRLNDNKINEINTMLEHINFYLETANDLFYQADTEKEYDLVIDKNENIEQLYNQLFEEYLNEEASYSNIHFDSIPSEITLPDEMSLRKIYK